jgi:hypothetical protein
MDRPGAALRPHGGYPVTQVTLVTLFCINSRERECMEEFSEIHVTNVTNITRPMIREMR